jgi:nucleoside-diphosphate-sugar epimerase
VERVTVTGETGFLGRRVVEELSSSYEVSGGGDSNLLFPDECADVFKRTRPNYIVHCAGYNRNVVGSSDYPWKIFHDNTVMALNVLQAASFYAHLFPVRKILCLMASCAYPADREVMGEDDLFDGRPHSTVECHGYAKRNVMLACKYASRGTVRGMKCVVVCPPTLFGECFDELTSVMTVSGPKNIRDIRVGDLVYTLNPNTHEVEVADVEAIQQTTTTEWVTFKNAGVDFRVTPNHQMYGKIGTGRYKKHSALFLAEKAESTSPLRQFTIPHHKKVAVPVTEEWKTVDLSSYVDDGHEYGADGTVVRDYNRYNCRWCPVAYDAGDFWEFVGWMISEGYSVPEKHQSSLTQDKYKNSENYQRIKLLLDGMSIPYSKTDEGFFFTSRLLRNYLIKETGVYSEGRFIPRVVFASGFPTEYRWRLFEAMMLGDGDKNGRRYSTNSTELKDGVLHLCMLLGIRASAIREYRNDGYGPTWRIKIPLKRFNRTVKFSDIRRERCEAEACYCLTTSKNNIVLAGRNNVFNWVGQCEPLNPYKTKVVGSVVEKVIRAKRENSPSVRLWGTGLPRRDVLYVGDAARLIVKVLQQYEDTESPLNISGGFEPSIAELAELVCGLVGYDGVIQWDDSMPDGAFRKRLDATRMHELLDLKGFAFTPLEEALRRTIADVEGRLPLEA